MIKLTYIVCVYNSASTILETLKSIYCQPLPENEFEVILVDDCSTDNSYEIVNNYKQFHKNMFVVRQPKNHRVGTSMNIGIRMAKGVYIQVVDGDDIVGNGIVDTLNMCLSSMVDASINTSQYESSDGTMHSMEIKSTLSFPMSSFDFCEKVLTDEPIYGGTQFYMWRTEFLHDTNHPFVEELKMEDTDWIEFHLFKAKTIGYSPYTTYIYKYNDNSQLHQMSVTTTADAILQSYRRLSGAKVYAERLTHFASIIENASHWRIRSSLRFRNLSKFWNCEYLVLYKRIGENVRMELSKYNYPILAKMFLRHKYITLCFLWSTVWVVHLCRFVWRKI